MIDSKLTSILASAAEEQRRGNPVGAIKRYRDALLHAPENAQAHNALGNLLLAQGAAAPARDHFRQAADADRSAPELWLNLAKACRLLADDAQEAEALGAALALDKRHFMARLRHAELSERVGDASAAAEHWGAVIALAPADRDCPPALLPLLAHGRAFLASRAEAFEAAIRPALNDVRRNADPASLRRFDACVNAALGKRRVYVNECHGLHYPFLPADEFFAREHFAWLGELEAETATIQAELSQLLGTGRGMVPYVQQEPGTPPNRWSDLDHSSSWSAFFLWRHGIRNAAACMACPTTTALIERLPLIDIPGRSPTVFFSILEPHTRIPPHTGVTNTRAIVHLPLVVPAGCGFRVGGETREWRVGEAFVFDDTIEHEAWNDSAEARAVLILDLWNPHLSENERSLLRHFFLTSDESGFGKREIEN